MNVGHAAAIVMWAHARVRSAQLGLDNVVMLAIFYGFF